jgi:hypothetical protein
MRRPKKLKRGWGKWCWTFAWRVADDMPISRCYPLTVSALAIPQSSWHLAAVRGSRQEWNTACQVQKPGNGSEESQKSA